MDNNSLANGGAAGEQTSASPTVPHNKESPNQPSQMMPTHGQQQDPRQDVHTNTTQPDLQMSPQSDHSLSPSDKNMGLHPQQQHQINNSSQHNLASGQTSINLPPPVSLQQQQLQSSPPQHQQQPQSLPPQQQQQQLQSSPPQQHHQPIKPLLADESRSDITLDIVPNQQNKQESPQKTIITKVKLSDELNIFDWFRTTDIIHQIKEKAKSSVDSVITTLDPGMREYLYSGGNINIVVISDSNQLVSPIRDSFHDVFGRATVVAARYDPPSRVIDYPIRTARGFTEAVCVAREKIKKFRSDTSSVPQNQVVIVVQSALVSIQNDDLSENKSNEHTQQEWFLTFCMLIEDPVLGVTLKSFSQLVPIDQDVIYAARASGCASAFQDKNLGFTISIDELMASKLKLSLEEMAGDEYGCLWLPKWSGIYETQVIYQLGLSLANSYQRKWNECASIETVVS